MALVIAMLNFMKTIPACVSPGTGKNGSTVAVSYRSYVIRIIHHFLFGFFFYLALFYPTYLAYSTLVLCYLSQQYNECLQGTSVLSPAGPLFCLVIPAWVIAYKSDQVENTSMIIYKRSRLDCRLFSMVTLSCTCCCLV